MTMASRSHERTRELARRHAELSSRDELDHDEAAELDELVAEVVLLSDPAELDALADLSPELSSSAREERERMIALGVLECSAPSDTRPGRVAPPFEIEVGPTFVRGPDGVTKEQEPLRFPVHWRADHAPTQVRVSRGDGVVRVESGVPLRVDVVDDAGVSTPCWTREGGGWSLEAPAATTCYLQFRRGQARGVVLMAPDELAPVRDVSIATDLGLYFIGKHAAAGTFRRVVDATGGMQWTAIFHPTSRGHVCCDPPAELERELASSRERVSIRFTQPAAQYEDARASTGRSEPIIDDPDFVVDELSIWIRERAYGQHSVARIRVEGAAPEAVSVLRTDGPAPDVRTTRQGDDYVELEVFGIGSRGARGPVESLVLRIGDRELAIELDRLD